MSMRIPGCSYDDDELRDIGREEEQSLLEGAEWVTCGDCGGCGDGWPSGQCLTCQGCGEVPEG